MQRGKGKSLKGRDSLPDSFESISEAGEFWDSHDTTDYEDMMRDVDFEVDIRRHVYLVPVAEEVLMAIREKARSQGVTTETMVNLLLQEHTV
ncbi:MAG: hypothetical protein JXL84_07235 [Deltaproteobacteria bacterium]|nr:hypothetical protein [Deltaproteobacteria bacterium]